jgi:tetratricopeptide (TPR) repeat protein
MLQLLLLAGVAALTALGCAENIESAEPSSPNKPPPPPDYPDQFGDDEKAKWVRHKLIEKGIHGPELDRGCPTFKYFADGRFERFFAGREDKKISSCEVNEFALDHYEKYPEIAEAIAEEALPWSLNDRNPATSDDEKKYQKQVQGAIAQLDQLLKKGGIQPGSVEYQEGMALGLFYFSAVPTSRQLDKRQEKITEIENMPDKTEEDRKEIYTKKLNLQETKNNIIEISRKMDNLNITEFRAFHEEWGGLYLSKDIEPSKEYSALQALKEDIGECSELSKILFGVLKMAGLFPVFVLVDPLKSKVPFMQRDSIQDPFSWHVCIGINLGKRFILLDPALVEINPPHVGYIPLTLREYLATDYDDHALTDKGIKRERKKELIEKALQLDPNSFLVWATRASLRSESEDWKGAIEDYTRAIEIYPSDAIRYFKRGAAWDKMGNKERAEADYNQAIARFPDFLSAYAYRGALFLEKNEPIKARADFIRALKISPKYASESIATALWERFNSELEKTETDHARATIEDELKPSFGLGGLKASVTVAGLLWELGQRELARKNIKDGVVGSVWMGQEERKKNNKRFSAATVKFLMSLFHDLPRSMQIDPKILADKKSLGLRGRP